MAAISELFAKNYSFALHRVMGVMISKFRGKDGEMAPNYGHERAAV